MRGPSLGNLVPDAALFQRQAVSAAIVGPIGLDRFWSSQWPPALAADRFYAVNQRQQLRNIMPVGLGQNDVDRDALRVDEKVVLAACLTTIG